ncbi:hypothetical protein E2986_13691 [Frieseomelitta varia]|uniref:Uncharacterized protein n=1 Tax=Frieseomelitta varia TaxID=561572 RepID=A0A833SFR6_9HYME|nr:hypothetical protein E2986_13691 [Frieseomelitta varia]
MDSRIKLVRKIGNDFRINSHHNLVNDSIICMASEQLRLNAIEKYVIRKFHSVQKVFENMIILDISVNRVEVFVIIIDTSNFLHAYCFMTLCRITCGNDYIPKLETECFSTCNFKGYVNHPVYTGKREKPCVDSRIGQVARRKI